jgi:hypothetical protein
VIASLPTGSDDVVSVATPLLTVAVPSAVPPLLNVTVPVTDDGNVSVNVTEVPKVEGFRDDVSADVGDAFETVCAAVPVAVLLVESPL